MSSSKEYWREMEEKHGWQGDRVKCRICGKVCLFLGSHIAKQHHIPADDYKDMFGLLRSFPLVSEELASDFSSINKKNRETGKLKTTESFLTSERNKGMQMPDAALAVIKEHSQNQVYTDERRKLVSDSQKKRYKNPEQLEKKRELVKAYWAKRAIYINCDQCGKPVRVSPSRMKKRYVFCNRQCLIEYSRDPRKDWLSHITKGHKRRIT